MFTSMVLFFLLLKPYFHFPHDEMAKWFTKLAIGKRWRDYRVTLFHKYYDPSLTKEQNIDQNCPNGITREQWKGLILIRDKQKHKVIQTFILFSLYQNI